MEIISDLHIHSRFARACSKDITINNLEKYAKIKGLNLLGTGDFTHPKWIQELKSELTPDDQGILWTKDKFPFLLQSEISLIYSQGGKGRRIHYVMLAPSFEVVDQITEFLLSRGRVDYDGRPIFGMSSIDLLENLRSISLDIEMICAHAFTSWFGIFGSKSGFNSIKECFEEKARYIHAIETGMSANPEMCWRIKELDNYQLVSFSDPHSAYPWRLGREATTFETKELTYKNILKAIRTGEGLKETKETEPSYGKFHYDGHRACNILFSPEQTRKHKGICPICKKPLTIGVEYRVEELAARSLGYKPENAKPFKTLIPLSELICHAYNIKQPTSKKCQEIYEALISKYKNEFNVLLNLNDFSNLEPKLVDLILKNRNRQLHIKPGYDGVYGEIIDEEFKTKEYETTQKGLFNFYV
ncbi:MAG TPA: endonuclease Q family protein [Candidatus Nanoarchaeia archaeon]|nr:endonuclease Q family protein [Candidatus Nanoarchaeia archaeon]